VAEGGIELGGTAGDVIGRVGGAEGVEVHFDGAEVVETPGVPGDAAGQFEFDGGFGR
jgi:hypothetical protein